LGASPKANRRDCLIYDYTWSGINCAVQKQAPAKAMQFGGALHRLLHTIVDADPRHGPVKMAKVDLGLMHRLAGGPFSAGIKTPAGIPEVFRFRPELFRLPTSRNLNRCRFSAGTSTGIF
jgi:hypothetical protein